MQSRDDGYLYQLDKEIMEKQGLQAAADKAIPNRAHQGPVFHEGEILEIKGGRFMVQMIRSRGRLFLKGLPSSASETPR